MTTGSPKVGNVEFKKSFTKRIPNSLRYVYGGDIITMMPPQITGYVHINDEIHLGPKKKLSFKDHLMDSYIPGLIEYLG